MDEQDVLFLKNEVKTLKERLDNLTEAVEKERTRGSQTALFFVRLDSSDIVLNKQSIVKFSEVNLDIGNNFNSGDGIFIAPVSGIYLFSWTTITYPGKNVDTELRVDNVVIDSMFGVSGTSGSVPVTKVVLCQVKKGDHVWIQTSSYYTENYFYTPNDSRSSFTGMLVVDN
ncbi:unnamed protein product [Mytilus edulis]|uniref:C1q domain-containing protein n=1 Tax=Mytilus edulis TaxID=6550 RepID=A0A8S3S744_MYTED|nr:unnamed protein product [Mytilus edulis]